MNKRQKKKANEIIGVYWDKTIVDSINGLDNLGIIMSIKKPKNLKGWTKKEVKRKDVR